MSEFDLVIRGGTAATCADVQRCDIGVRDGRVVAMGEGLRPGTRELDAHGLLVLPGGVDGHCHLDQPMLDGARMADDFLSGTRSAACGGTTTVIPFACQFRGRSLRSTIEDYHQRAAGKALVDYAFHVIVSDPTPEVLQDELPGLIREGYTSFKLYMTYDDLKLDDRQILDVLALLKREGGMAMIHAENTDCIAWLTQQLEDSGRMAPRFHATSRPAVVEREATHRAISFAELLDVPILIVHVSSAEAVEQIRWGQGRGLKVFAETCPQYLFLTEADLGMSHDQGIKCICSPPPRDKGNQKMIWDGLVNGAFHIFSSDHAPFRFDDPLGKKRWGSQPRFAQVPNGIPGIETRMPLLFSEGVHKGRISLQQFVALTATNPAKMYGLYPRKGTIGSDADLVLWDPEHSLVLRNELLHHNVDYTPYEGMNITGWPVLTMVRGEVVQERGELRAVPGSGRFLPCKRPSFSSHAALLI